MHSANGRNLPVWTSCFHATTEDSSTNASKIRPDIKSVVESVFEGFAVETEVVNDDDFDALNLFGVLLYVVEVRTDVNAEKGLETSTVTIADAVNYVTTTPGDLMRRFFRAQSEEDLEG